MSKEVMKLALEALEDVQYYGWGQTERDYDARTAAITAIREAQAEQTAQQEYERGFIDGMQEQMKRSVDRAVNAMAQRTWVGLTDEEILIMSRYDLEYAALIGEVQRKLKEKNA